ncbi:hypothetical protein KXD40_003145 [Peronospora effusa]|uniref:Uncharacterized protein n=1 Tax=Peronospora effusa TaxID=542832 RepID=A0A3M6V7X3_9STRA|nr:hypothetical protein DD238_006201 [Peronospora effusa]UIZ29290.1 hypothetical protein KXD40_003145 [Peronospora effusa]
MWAGGCALPGELRKFVTNILFLSPNECERSTTASVPTSKRPSSRTMGFESTAQNGKNISRYKIESMAGFVRKEVPSGRDPKLTKWLGSSPENS